MSPWPYPLRIAALSAIVLVALLVPASGAFASTVTFTGSTVTFSAASGIANNTDFSEVTDNELTIDTVDDPVVYDDEGNTTDVIDDNGSGDECVDADDTQSPATQVVCTDVDIVVANGNNSSDDLDASGLNNILATLNGGIDDDELYGGQADASGDTLNGDDGEDYIEGNDGDDAVNGGAGDDEMYGEADDDVMRGNDGDDYWEPGDGVDNSDGGAGNDDTYEADDGDNDISRGGTGVDDFFFGSCDVNLCSANDDVHIDENGAADDGDTEDDPDNNWDGFENVDFNNDGDNAATVLSTNGNDTIDGDSENDVFTPRAGIDFVDMAEDDDTANTVDGYPDIVECGDGDDTANADQFDELRHCEDVNITNVESAFDDPDTPDDFPPSVSFSNLDPNSFLPPIGTQLTANANDDNGVTLVVFFDDTERLCDDTTAPYTCQWEPTSDDVGENTLTVFAMDTVGQFGADIMGVTVGKFSPDSLDVSATKRDLNGPRRTRVSGELELPAGVSSEDGCDGDVRVRILDGTDRIRSRRIPLMDDCSYSHRFRLPGVAKLEHEKVKIKTKFMGNDVLGKEKGDTVKTKVQDL
jgi:Big-like domain-containing protein/hemolysin type calcium-binding protein